MPTFASLAVIVCALGGPHGEPAAPPLSQPPWLECYVRFQTAGQQLASGHYDEAEKTLAQARDILPVPYRELAARRHGKLMQLRAVRGRARAGDPFGPPRAAFDVLDLFGSPRDPDARGDPVKSVARRDLAGFGDMQCLAELCESLHDYESAAVLYRRALDHRHDDDALQELIGCLIALNRPPNEVARFIERIEDAERRAYCKRRLEPLHDTHQHADDFDFRLRHWNRRAPLRRLAELERLRPLISTEEQQILFLRQRACAFGALGDDRQRDECFERIINEFSHRPKVCGEILLRAAQQAHQYGRERDNDNSNAIAYYRRIVEEHPRCPQVGQALSDLGHILYRQHETEEAIEYLERLFAWAGESDERTDSREPFHVRLHRPAVTLSRACGARGEFAKALYYARLARDKYPYRGGGCLVGVRRHYHTQMDMRVRDLERLAAGRKLESYDPLKIEIPKIDPLDIFP